MSNPATPFGKSYNSPSVFGLTPNANTSAFGPNLFGTGGSSVPFGTTSGIFGGSSLLSSTSTSGTSTASVFGGSGWSGNIFGSPSVFGQSTDSASNPYAISSQLGGPRAGGTSNDRFGEKNGSNSLFNATASTVSAGSTAPFGATSGPSFASTYQSFGGGQSTTPAFGTAGFAFSNLREGSRRAAYCATRSIDEGNGKLQSISAMPVYSGKSHEELQLEDYNCSDRGVIVNGGSTSPLDPRPSFSTFAPHTSYNPFSAQTSSGWFRPQTTSNTVSIQTSSTFSPPTSFGPFSNQTPHSFFPAQPSTNPFAPESSISPLGPRPSFSPLQPQTTSNGFSTQTSSGLVSTRAISSSIPPQTSSIFSPPTSFGPFSNQTLPSSNGFSNATSFNPLSNQTSPSLHSTQIPATTFAPSTSSFTFPTLSDPIAHQLSFAPFFPAISTSSFAPHPATDKGSVSAALPVLNNSHYPTSSNPASGLNSFLTTIGPSSSPPFVALSPSVSTSPQIHSVTTPWPSTQTVHTTNLQSLAEVRGPSTHQGPAPGSTVVGQPVVNSSPSGEFPAMTRLSISQPGSTVAVQYGISSMPVHDKPSAPVRLSSSLTSRPLSHHRMRLPARKYDSKSDGRKVPFFVKDEESPFAIACTLVPRENPRALVVHSAELWPQRSETEKASLGDNVSLHEDEHGVSSENNTNKEPDNIPNINHQVYEPDTHEDKISKERMDKIQALMPQLSIPGYYTEPPIKQLAEKEMEDSGFCSRVNDFVIGRCGYGSIKFLGETDVRRLCLDSVVEFDKREIVVYKKENEKPPPGEGLNKPAEVTLLNILCIDKKTGKKYVDGPKVERYKEMLIKKGEKQGVEFISFDPVKGEWKFRIQHF